MFLRILTLLMIFFGIGVPLFISPGAGSYEEKAALQHMSFDNPWAVTAWIIWAVWMVYPVVLHVQSEWKYRKYT